jgi:hypothetical protein
MDGEKNVETHFVGRIHGDVRDVDEEIPKIISTFLM